MVICIFPYWCPGGFSESLSLRDVSTLERIYHSLELHLCSLGYRGTNSQARAGPE